MKSRNVCYDILVWYESFNFYWIALNSKAIQVWCVIPIHIQSYPTSSDSFVLILIYYICLILYLRLIISWINPPKNGFLLKISLYFNFSKYKAALKTLSSSYPSFPSSYYPFTCQQITHDTKFSFLFSCFIFNCFTGTFYKSPIFLMRFNFFISHYQCCCFCSNNFLRVPLSAADTAVNPSGIKTLGLWCKYLMVQEVNREILRTVIFQRV